MQTADTAVVFISGVVWCYVWMISESSSTKPHGQALYEPRTVGPDEEKQAALEEEHW